MVNCEDVQNEADYEDARNCLHPEQGEESPYTQQRDLIDEDDLRDMGKWLMETFYKIKHKGEDMTTDELAEYLREYLRYHQAIKLEKHPKHEEIMGDLASYGH